MSILHTTNSIYILIPNVVLIYISFISYIFVLHVWRMSDGARGGFPKFTCFLHPIYYYIYNRYWSWNVDNYVRDGNFLLQFHLHSTDHCQIRFSFWDIFWEDLLVTFSLKSHELWAWQISDHRKSHHQNSQTFPLFTINHILKSFK